MYSNFNRIDNIPNYVYDNLIFEIEHCSNYNNGHAFFMPNDINDIDELRMDFNNIYEALMEDNLNFEALQADDYFAACTYDLAESLGIVMPTIIDSRQALEDIWDINEMLMDLYDIEERLIFEWLYEED